MKIPPMFWPTVFLFACIHSCTTTKFVSCQCLDNQKSLLLTLRSNLEFNHTLSTKLVSWNQSTDCCSWSGVACNTSNGRVTGLDLSNEAITKVIDSLNSLFRLQFLQTLNLAYNPVLGNIPSAIGSLSSLTDLNLSHTAFSGQVPLEISHLVNLVNLDLSMSSYEFSPLSIQNPKFETIIQNLTKVRELYLDGIAISAEGNKWGEALSTSLPHLQVLSMPNCNLTGGFHSSLSKLRSLFVISLDNNAISARVPEFLARFTNLTTLKLFGCNLTGTFPQEIFQVPTLAYLDLGYNPSLQGTLPYISTTASLITINLFECNFQGIISPSLGRLSKLNYLDLSYNNFSGPVPSFSSAKNLSFLELSYNSLSGSIPTSLFSTDSMVQYLAMSSNSLEGPIPNSILQLIGLRVLVLSSNRLNGTVMLHEIFGQLQNLQTLELSHNYFSIDTSNTTGNTSFPLLGYIGLASGNLSVLPDFLEFQPYLFFLDLSNNQIQGKIPKWIWQYGLNSLNLSRNNFESLEEPPLPDFPYNLQFLDLHSNNIQGRLPAIPSQTVLLYLDFSNNSFISSFNPDIGNSFSSAQYISFAQNMIYGSIPTSFCNATSLQVLDLSSNNLSGTIPACLTTVDQNLAVLNLRDNKLHGRIPDEFGVNCTLETINFNGNFLEGPIPTSLANCKGMSVLDLGNNKLNDTFPCHLKSLSSLQVLVLRSNRFHGSVVCRESKSSWPLIQIIDLASNLFTGQLTTIFHGKKRMATTNETSSRPSSLQYSNASSSFAYYQYEVEVTFKGLGFELQKILTIFTSIDLSDNAFHGGLPTDLGNLNALKVLNLSHNSITGHIPKSTGNLSQLESLDLSYNAISGSIPQQLASLSFLEYLNLSFNNLAGSIPTSTQLQSFDASSYEGNPGLYGPPLTVSGRNKHSPGLVPPTFPGQSHSISSRRLLEWLFSGVAVGFPVGIIIFFGPLLCVKRLREWYNYHVDRLLMKMLPDSQRRKRSKKASIKQRPRN